MTVRPARWESLLPVPALACVLFAAAATAQGTPFEREVDGLIRFFRQAQGKNGALGDGSCRHTAMVLTAMGRCHRGYSSADGPVVRGPVKFLFTCRRADGSFADAADKDPVTTTLWVHDALQSIDAEAYAAEIATVSTWLKAQTGKTSAFATFSATTEPAALAAALQRGPLQDGDPQANVEALVALVRAQVDARGGHTAPAAAWSQAQQKGSAFLLQHQEGGRFFVMVPVGKEEKSFMKHFDAGITGMGLAALQTKPAAQRSADEQKVIDQGLAWLASQQDERGGIGTDTINYVTSAAVMALAKSGDPAWQPVLKKAQRFLLAIQNVEEQGYAQGDRDYGSVGYGGDERGDLSNTNFAVQALRETGLPADDEAFAKAIVFLQRTQNLKGSFQGREKSGSGEWESRISGNDGGSAYYPGNSPAGYIELPDGSKIPRSYGSMTYALLKTYTLCGAKRDDPRVAAAVQWIAKNFDLDSNPGADVAQHGEKVRYQGLYYYYMVMAQALDTMGIDALEVPRGEGKTERIPWRTALRGKLASLQRADGGWVNDRNGRWYESSDVVCTAYAMLALGHCR